MKYTLSVVMIKEKNNLKYFFQKNKMRKVKYI